MFALTGGAVRGLYTNAIGNEGQVDIELVPAEERDITTTAYIAELRPKVAKLLAPGASLTVMQEKMRGIRSARRVRDRGRDQRLRRSTPCFAPPSDMAARLRERPELTNVHVSLDYSKPEWQVEIDRVKAGELRADRRRHRRHAAWLYRRPCADPLPRRPTICYDLRVIVPERELREPQRCRGSGARRPRRRLRPAA
ncbi:MAG: hypothetical protein MZV65_45865 [Chromatiales bacterium]|nr:hypothetical protein [Chromatiales bacterium]